MTERHGWTKARFLWILLLLWLLAGLTSCAQDYPTTSLLVTPVESLVVYRPATHAPDGTPDGYDLTGNPVVYVRGARINVICYDQWEKWTPDPPPPPWTLWIVRHRYRLSATYLDGVVVWSRVWAPTDTLGDSLSIVGGALEFVPVGDTLANLRAEVYVAGPLTALDTLLTARTMWREGR